MIVKKYRFSIATNYINSEYSQIVDVEFEDDSTEEEIEEVLNECYTEWLNENNHGSIQEIK